MLSVPHDEVFYNTWRSRVPPQDFQKNRETYILLLEKEDIYPIPFAGTFLSPWFSIFSGFLQVGYVIVPWSSPRSPPFLKLLRLKFKKFQDRDCWRKQTFTIFTVCTCPLPATHFRCVPFCDAVVDEPTQRPLHIQPCNYINHICSFLISCQKKYYISSFRITSTSTATAPPSTRSTKKPQIPNTTTKKKVRRQLNHKQSTIN